MDYSVEPSRIREAAEVLSDSSTEVDRWEHLIAAAPELLVALEWALTNVQAPSGSVEDTEFARRWNCFVDALGQARAAIRKARSDA